MMLSTLKCLGFSSRGLCVFENPPFHFISSSSLKLQRIKAEKAEITRFFQKPKTPQAPKVSTQRFPLAFFSVSVRLLLLKTNTVPLPSQPAFRQRGLHLHRELLFLVEPGGSRWVLEKAERAKCLRVAS